MRKALFSAAEIL